MIGKEPSPHNLGKSVLPLNSGDPGLIINCTRTVFPDDQELFIPFQILVRNAHSEMNAISKRIFELSKEAPQRIESLLHDIHSSLLQVIQSNISQKTSCLCKSGEISATCPYWFAESLIFNGFHDLVIRILYQHKDNVDLVELVIRICAQLSQISGEIRMCLGTEQSSGKHISKDLFILNVSEICRIYLSIVNDQLKFDMSTLMLELMVGLHRNYDSDSISDRPFNPAHIIFSQEIKNPDLFSVILDVSCKQKNSIKRKIIENITLLISSNSSNAKTIIFHNSWKQKVVAMLISQFAKVRNESDSVTAIRNLSYSVVNGLRHESKHRSILAEEETVSKIEFQDDVDATLEIEEMIVEEEENISEMKGIFVLEMNLLSLLLCSSIQYENSSRKMKELLDNLFSDIRSLDPSSTDTDSIGRVVLYSILKRIQTISFKNKSYMSGSWKQLRKNIIALLEYLVKFIFHFWEGSIFIYINPELKIPDLLLVNQVVFLFKHKHLNQLLGDKINVDAKSDNDDSISWLDDLCKFFVKLKVFFEDALRIVKLKSGDKDNIFDIVDYLAAFLDEFQCRTKLTSLSASQTVSRKYKKMVQTLGASLNSSFGKANSSVISVKENSKCQKLLSSYLLSFSERVSGIKSATLAKPKGSDRKTLIKYATVGNHSVSSLALSQNLNSSHSSIPSVKLANSFIFEQIIQEEKSSSNFNARSSSLEVLNKQL